MGFKTGSKAPEILRLWSEGLPIREIAERVRCSEPNVCMAIKRHEAAGLVVPAVHHTIYRWLENEGRKSLVAPGVIARAILIDAFNDAMGIEDAAETIRRKAALPTGNSTSEGTTRHD